MPSSMPTELIILIIFYFFFVCQVKWPGINAIYFASPSVTWFSCIHYFIDELKELLQTYQTQLCLLEVGFGYIPSYCNLNILV